MNEITKTVEVTYIPTIHAGVHKQAGLTESAWSNVYLIDACDAASANFAFAELPAKWVRDVKEGYGKSLDLKADDDTASASEAVSKVLKASVIRDYRHKAMNALIWALVAKPTPAAIKKITLTAASELGLTYLETMGENAGFCENHISGNQRRKTLKEAGKNPDTGLPMNAEETKAYDAKVKLQASKDQATKSADKADSDAKAVEAQIKPENLVPHINDTLHQLHALNVQIKTALKPENSKTSGSKLNLAKLLEKVTAIIDDNNV